MASNIWKADQLTAYKHEIERTPTLLTQQFSVKLNFSRMFKNIFKNTTHLTFLFSTSQQIKLKL